MWDSLFSSDYLSFNTQPTCTPRSGHICIRRLATLRRLASLKNVPLTLSLSCVRIDLGDMAKDGKFVMVSKPAMRVEAGLAVNKSGSFLYSIDEKLLFT